MRLIDADALPEMEIERCDTTDAFEIKAKVAGRNHMRKIINDAPTIDAVPVRYGEWIPNNPFTGNCSECGSESNMKDKYCPNCGARMTFNDKQETESKNIKSSLEYDYCGIPKLRYDIEARIRGEHDG